MKMKVGNDHTSLLAEGRLEVLCSINPQIPLFDVEFPCKTSHAF